MTASQPAPQPGPHANRHTRSLGGLRAAANMSPEARSERSRKAAEARWRAENERRQAAGEAPTKKAVPILSATELEPWLEEVDRRWPDRRWASKEARRSQALILARQAIAETLSAMMREQGR